MLSALRRRNFVLLWVGQLVSLSGDWLLVVALPFYVLQLTGSILQMGIMFMAEMLPRVLFGSLAGVFVDRWDRRRTMIVADLLRAGFVLLLLLVHSKDLLWLIYVVMMVQSIITQFFTPAASAIIPSIVDEQALVGANSLSSLSESVTRFIGPPLGGILFALSGLMGIVLLDSATFLFSACAIVFIVVPKLVNEKQKMVRVASAIAKVGRELVEGLQLIKGEAVLLWTFVVMSILMLGQGDIYVLLVVFIQRVMHGGSEVYGWMITAQGVGSLVGALLVGGVTKFVRPVYLVTCALVIASCSFFVIINVPVLGLVIPLIAFVGLFSVGGMIVFQTLLQSNVSDKYRGRVFGTLSTVLSLSMLVGMLIASAFGDSLGIVPLLNVVPALFLLGGGIGWVKLQQARLVQQEVSQEPVSSEVV
jgi:Arabinose efflux permease